MGFLRKVANRQINGQLYNKMRIKQEQQLIGYNNDMIIHSETTQKNPAI